MECELTQEDLDLRYIAECLRGAGAFGKVHIYGIKQEYKSPITMLPNRLAVKSFAEHNADSAKREIRILKELLKEPYVVTMISHTTSSPYLIFMECCNSDLTTYARCIKRFVLSQKDVFKMCKDMLHGLISLERWGIIHRDIKPRNFLVDFCGGDGSRVQETKIKICDFGCCRSVNIDKMKRNELGDLTKNWGTDGFKAPEITCLEGKEDYCGKYTSSVDMWGFGITALFLTSGGQVPFTEEIIKQLFRDINSVPKRNNDIKSKILELVGDSFTCISKIIIEVLKWNPEERLTAKKCLTLVEHLEKYDDPAVKKRSGQLNMPSTTSVIPEITVPNEAKVKKILGHAEYDVILESCDNDSIKTAELLLLAKNLDSRGRLHEEMKKETELHADKSTKIHCRKLFSLWYKTSGSNMSMQRIIQSLQDPLISLNGLAMELSNMIPKNASSIFKLPDTILSNAMPEVTKPIVVLLGKTGKGKSTFANILLDRNDFEVGDGCHSVTEDVKECHGFLNNNKDKPLCVIDTPGMDDSGDRDQKHLDSIVDYLQKLGSVSALVLVMKKTSGRFSASLKSTLKIFEMSFGCEFWSHLVLKVKESKNSKEFIEILKADFPNSRDVDIASNIFELDCKLDFASKEEYDQALSPFYELVNSKGHFDCSSIDAVKTERTILKNENCELKSKNKELTEEMFKLTGVNKNAYTQNVPNTDNEDTKNYEKQQNTNKANSQILYVPEDVMIKHETPPSETSQSLKPLELKKDNYMLTFKNDENKEVFELSEASTGILNNDINKEDVEMTSDLEEKIPSMSTEPHVTVLVGNITERAPDTMIQHLLSTCGSVIIWNRGQGDTGKARDFGFCEYSNPDAALRSVRLLHNLTIFGKTLAVNVDDKTQNVLDRYKEERMKMSVRSSTTDSADDDYIDNDMKQEDELARIKIVQVIQNNSNEIDSESSKIESITSLLESSSSLRKEDKLEKESTKSNQSGCRGGFINWAAALGVTITAISQIIVERFTGILGTWLHSCTTSQFLMALASIIMSGVVVCFYALPQIGRKIKKELGLDDEKERRMTIFQKEQKNKSINKVKDVEKTKKLLIAKCLQLLGPIVKVGGFVSKTEVIKKKGIHGVKTFEDVVDNLGQQLNLDKKVIEGIKLNKSVDSDTHQISNHEINTGSENEAGSIELFTGSYFVQRREEDKGKKIKFDLEIAMSVIKITKVAFEKLPGSAIEAVRHSWLPSLSSNGADHKKDGNRPEDWKTFFEYTANKQLMEEL